MVRGGKLIQTCRSRFRSQSLLPFLRQFKGLRIYHVTQWLQLARLPPQAQPPFAQRARLQLLKRYAHVLACRLSCCISLESRLVLNSEYSKLFSFYFSVLLLSLLIFTANSLLVKQLRKGCVWKISYPAYFFSLVAWLCLTVAKLSLFHVGEMRGIANKG